jgi:hypothetical protein
MTDAEGILPSTKRQRPICSICHKPYTGKGNDARPVATSRCCDDCDHSVGAERIRLIMERDPVKIT